MMELGKKQTLLVVKTVDFGVYLALMAFFLTFFLECVY